MHDRAIDYSSIAAERRSLSAHPVYGVPRIPIRGFAIDLLVDRGRMTSPFCIFLVTIITVVKISRIRIKLSGIGIPDLH